MCFSMPVLRSAALPRTARTIGERTIFAASTIRASCSSAVPCALSNIAEVGQIDRIPISRSSPSSSARARTFFRLSGSRLPRNRISLKCTTLTFHFAAKSICWNGVQFCAPRLNMSTPNRTGAAGLAVGVCAVAVPGACAPSAIVAAPRVFTNVRRSAGMASFVDMAVRHFCATTVDSGCMKNTRSAEQLSIPTPAVRRQGRGQADD